MNASQHFNHYALQHIYVRAEDCGVIFYSLEDRLVYYTISACMAKRHKIVVAAAAIMFTHTHQSIAAHTLGQIHNYLHDANSSFARMYNNHYGRCGRLFDRHPGRSQKKSSKEQRTNLIYVFNNHVEKQLCRSSTDERWAFLPYFLSPHPFSQPINLKQSSKEMRRFIKLVDRRVNRGAPLDYKDLNTIFTKLYSFEKEQFVDYVISKYNWIDPNYSISLFKDLDSMIRAIDSSTGSEYSIKEEFTKFADTQYVNLIRYAESHDLIASIHTMSKPQKINLVNSLCRYGEYATPVLSKFFHICHE